MGCSGSGMDVRENIGDADSYPLRGALPLSASPRQGPSPRVRATYARQNP